MNEILNEEEGPFGRVVLIKKLGPNKEHYYQVNHYVNETKTSYGPYSSYDVAQDIFNTLKEKYEWI